MLFPISRNLNGFLLSIKIANQIFSEYNHINSLIIFEIIFLFFYGVSLTQSAMPFTLLCVCVTLKKSQTELWSWFGTLDYEYVIPGAQHLG